MQSRCNPRLARFVIAAFFIVSAAAQTTLLEIRVAGNERLPSAAISAASGLHVGSTVTRADFDAASQKLFDTGFFQSVNYGYDPKRVGEKTGFVVTLLLAEEPARTPVVLDIPDVDEEQVWRELKHADPFVDRLMPDNEHAAAFYQHAIEACLRKLNREEPIVVKSEADLQTGKMQNVFLPANLPNVGEVHFEGNQVLSTAVLQTATSKLVLDRDFTPRSFRSIVELNLRPLYEDQAHLTVTFPQIKIARREGDKVAVNVAIDEGPLWSLGKVDLTGDEIPTDELLKAAGFAVGKPAYWKQFLACISSMERVLKTNGYLQVASNPVRSLHEETRIVDVNVQVRKGRQFLFGALQLNGLEPGEEQKAMKLWQLAGGQPLNEPYISDYLRSLLKSLSRQVKSVASTTRLRPGTNIMDVVITIK